MIDSRIDLTDDRIFSQRPRNLRLEWSDINVYDKELKNLYYSKICIDSNDNKLKITPLIPGLCGGGELEHTCECCGRLLFTNQSLCNKCNSIMDSDHTYNELFCKTIDELRMQRSLL